MSRKNVSTSQSALQCIFDGLRYFLHGSQSLFVFAAGVKRACGDAQVLDSLNLRRIEMLKMRLEYVMGTILRGKESG